MERTKNRKLGQAWVLLCIGLLLHVTDEALTGFLSVYNPTVLAIRDKIPWFPMPTFQFGSWLAGLLIGIAVLFALSPAVFRGAAWIRPIAYLFAAIMILNALGHTAGTIAGQTFDAIPVSRPMPGFYSSPFIMAAALYLVYCLRSPSSTDSRARHVSDTVG